jgi:prepilin-type N-terminal cleavage/methylation domain-containing protein
MLKFLKKVHGFTLLELLVVMTIVGILMTTAFVIFKNNGKSARLKSAALIIKNKILLARTSAITKSRKFAVRITPTEHKKWKVVIIDSVDNVLGNDKDRIGDKPYFVKKITFDGKQEIIITPEGEISHFTSNPIILTDSSDEDEIWELPVILYKTTGKIKIGTLVKNGEKTDD